MIDALHISESGLKSNQKWIDAISNNVANMQTVGFKKSQVQFSNMVASIDGAQNNSSSTESGDGTRISQVNTIFSPGPIKATNQVLDVAINGSGFLELIHPEGGFRYTRNGRLSVNNEGQLVGASGLVLSDDIRFSPDVTEVHIDKSGNVKAKVGASVDLLDLGQIRLARVANESGLRPTGDGLFAVTEESGDVGLNVAAQHGSGEILQGYLEMSNVDLVEEMTSLVLAQRAYQLNARIIQTADQIMETVNNLRR